VPYFCELLQVRDAPGQTTRIAARQRTAVHPTQSGSRPRRCWQPLTETPADELADLPCYVVRYIGNFEG